QRHWTQLDHKPVRDEKDQADAEEDLVPVLSAEPTFGRRHGHVGRAQRVAERFHRTFVFVAEVASTAGGREVDESSLVEPARDLRAVRVDEHLLVLALYVVDRDRASGGRADTEREAVDAPGVIRIEYREVGYGFFSDWGVHVVPRTTVDGRESLKLGGRSHDHSKE